MLLKKKKPQQMYSYSNWSDDFGFLILMINKKLEIAKAFNLVPFAQQMTEKTEFVHDNDIDGEENGAIYTTTVDEIYSSLSPKYINFLVDKYFGSDKALITFIAETVREELVIASVDINKTKIKDQYVADKLDKISELNQMAKKESQ